MKLLSIVTLAASSVLAVNATAQQLPTPPIDNEQVTSPYIGGERDFKTYQFVKVPTPVSGNDLSQRSGEQLLAGTEMVNTLSGKSAYVSGIISVLTKDIDVNALAQQFGLTVERIYGRLDLALLRAPEGTEMLQLRRDMMDVTGVNNADVEIVEDIREPHVL